jgi:ADP-ribosylglycohydrolase
VRRQDRARGALYGLAIGDALGMPTQLLSRPQIVERWGPLLTGFEAAPDDHPIAAGMPAGAVTDDTEQAVLLGRLLVDGGGRVDPAELAAALLGWEREMAARGSLDLLGPSRGQRCKPASPRPRPAATATPTAPRCALPRSASPPPPTPGCSWSTACSRRAW